MDIEIEMREKEREHRGIQVAVLNIMDRGGVTKSDIQGKTQSERKDRSCSIPQGFRAHPLL